jgi:hypothetical protein
MKKSKKEIEAVAEVVQTISDVVDTLSGNTYGVIILLDNGKNITTTILNKNVDVRNLAIAALQAGSEILNT